MESLVPDCMEGQASAPVQYLGKAAILGKREAIVVIIVHRTVRGFWEALRRLPLELQHGKQWKCRSLNDIAGCNREHEKQKSP